MISYEKVIQRLEGVRKYSRYVAAICPFHDDSKPSLLVFTDGWFRCLGCGKAGTLDDLWRGLSGWSPKPATYHEPTTFSPLFMPTSIDELEVAMDTAHEILDQNVLSLGWYLRMRKVEGRMETCRLGWMSGWYTIPIYSYPSIAKNGRLVGAVARAGSHIQEATGQRFSQPKDQNPLLYCPDRFLMDQDFLVVVFGMFDTLALSEMRIPSVTTTAGKDNFEPEWLDFWRKKILVLPDKNEEDAAYDLISKFGWRGRMVKVDWPEGMKDSADCLQHDRKDVVMNAIRNAT